MATRLKKTILKLLKEDEELRYTIAGYLGLSEILKRMDAMETEMRKIWEELKTSREGQEKMWKGQEKLWAEVRDIRITLDRVAVKLDRLTISVEEKALSHVRHRLREMLEVDVELGRLFVDSREIDIYGVAGDLVLSARLLSGWRWQWLTRCWRRLSF